MVSLLDVGLEFFQDIGGIRSALFKINDALRTSLKKDYSLTREEYRNVRSRVNDIIWDYRLSSLIQKIF